MTFGSRLLIDGELVAGDYTLDVVNPATGEVFATVARASRRQAEAAIEAAKRAQPAWDALGWDARSDLLKALADAVEERRQDFIDTMVAEQGKPRVEAAQEVDYSIAFIRHFAGLRLPEKDIRMQGGRVELRHRPLGVVAGISPWNFPLLIPAAKIAPALVTGNTMVMKPAPTTPILTLMLGELAAAILPAGVLNVITDQNDLGDLLTSHPDIAKVTFTGSTATGRRIMASAAPTLKRLTLELGGNDAAIVLDDVDPKVAARKVYDGAMLNAGQICVAVKRAYVPSSIYDEFCDEIAKLANQAIVDDGSKQGTTIGPIQNRMQFERVCELLADAKKRGKVIAGGEPLDREGYFIPPTIVRDLPEDARLVREEQFGPVLPVMRYDDVDDVIARANNSEFGLGGTVWGKDVDRAIAIAKRVDTGTIWVNQHLAIDPTIPFRGAKQSGLGAELGEAGLNEYTQAHIVNAVELA